jgi:uncharacterized membrane protein
VLLLAGVAYLILERAIVLEEGPGSKLAAAIGNETKGKLSATLYAVAIALAFVDRRISDAIYVCVALMWLVPDRRIEAKLKE